MRHVSNLHIKGVLLDYGGVLAEEGFREGLKAIGRLNGLSPDEFFEAGAALVYESGYVVGASDEAAYWNLLRDRTGIKGTDEQLRREILDRFVLREWMAPIVLRLKEQGLKVAILSDQTQWLNELDARDGFFKEFDAIFNSFYMGKGKKDPAVFLEVSATLGMQPSELVFVDDNPGNVERARSKGLNGIVFTDEASFLAELHESGLLD